MLSPSLPAVAAVALSLLSLPGATATALLEGYGRDPYPVPCAQACQFAGPTALQCPEFEGLSAEEMALAFPSGACMANDTAYLTTVAWCIHSYCDKSIETYKIANFWETKLIAEDGVVLRYTYEEALAQIDPKKPPQPLDLTETVVNRTIATTEDVYIAFLNAVKAYQASGKNESKYSLVVFLSCVIIPIAFSFLRFVPIPERLRSKLYAYLIDPPAFGKKHSAPILGLGIVPTRGQALFIMYIIAINTLAVFEGYPNFQPNGYFPDRRYELMRQIGNRAGVIAFANMPLLILFAGRNSLLLWLTNWSHSTFLLLHRWIAMISIIQVVVHSLLWLQMMVESDSHAEAVTYPYWYWGIVGTLAFCLFWPFSLLCVRKVLYEVFLITHICLAVLAIVASWYHIWYLYEDSSGFEIWLLIAIAVWGYERLLRVLRVSRHGIKRAHITRIEGDQYIRLDIQDVDCHAHCYIYFPTLTWRVWENHPFSVVNCSVGKLNNNIIDSNSSAQSQSETEGPIVMDPDSKETGNVTANRDVIATRTVHPRPGITLFIRAQSGLTKKIAAKANKEGGIPVLIEGSYGHGSTNAFTPTAEYPNVLCIAGGVGITGILPALSSSLSIFARPLGTTKLYWGIKDRGLVDAVKSMIVGDSKDGEKGDETNWGHVESHVMIGSRMNIRQVLSEELENAPGGTIVVVCGPHAMCDEARYACASLARHGAKVRYVEESFSW
ncbi:ferric reductase like transmembrane component-domain-containing protein [Fusarium solani]|uniref:Ferric reductase like transmembrane component-domain-containing protein n=1 Tax=Fusarium solani TaxID=169388 RepID=A0A9P9KTP0_FUSSL|nr:ferric reductase like transmembrane component-domain-containing protein [Fusarium solani]KAH7268455.1 ferric reductase like transmembrane component-domain-containing protein [Fusarium solani]